MVLVNYSESDESDVDLGSTSQPAAKETSAQHKPMFQKVVDRSNPHKIRVSLPTTSKHITDDDAVAPPSKRLKVGPNAFSGFNSLLPAPKKMAAPTDGNRGSGNGTRKGVLGSGVSLKTGSTPGFSRESELRIDDSDCQATEGVAQHGEDISNDHNPFDQEPETSKTSNCVYLEPKTQGNPTMFRPLSVTRKPKKKKPALSGIQSENATRDPGQTKNLEDVPKISLFAAGKPQEFQSQVSSPVGEYQPMIYQAPDSTSNPLESDLKAAEGSKNDEVLTDTLTGSKNHLLDQSSQSLSAVASDLNLSASAKRQLLGRQQNHTSNIKVVNFNTDQEYAANEILRQAGEQAQHNPVRAIAPGKHSLKQLVNAASNQKDALEEHFATGRRNKKEAGSKYGWG